jgi:hypothetical protein
MPDSVVTEAAEQDTLASVWNDIQKVLAGAQRPSVDAGVVKLVEMLTDRPCDVRISPAGFESWHVIRPYYTQLRFEQAAPVLHYVMRLLGLTQASAPRVGVIERVRLGAHFPERKARAIWLLPEARQIELRIRKAPWQRAHVGVAVPKAGIWAPPAAFPRNQGAYVAAAFPCPRCHVLPEQFLELPNRAGFSCPACEKSFVPRISWF